MAEIRVSFAKTEISPFPPYIAETFKTFEENTRIAAACAAERFQGLEPACPLQSVRKGHTDRETFEAVSDLVAKASGKHALLSFRALQHVAVVMKKRVTVNVILQDIAEPN